jgi:Na+-translocating ferredoxin:NAD+ oxidoreductase subunit B
MGSIILYAVIALCGIAAGFAVIIFFVEQKFKVIEDPKIDEVQSALPSANCGGCGFAGCRAFAEAIVRAGTLDKFNCPVGGADVMHQVAKILGVEAAIKEPQVAVVRCNGSYTHAPGKVEYDGAMSCQFAHQLYSGDSGCPYGCLWLGDCVAACKFDAMYMDNTTGLPVVLQDQCVACGACVRACPRSIIEMRNKQKKNLRIYVACINMEKGAVAKKNCSVACIGCSKCFNVCPHEAIEMKADETGKLKLLAYIDYEKCKLCRKCAPECPTKAIHEVNFPPRKEPVKTETAKTEA